MNRECMDYDVVIVGAGPSGLSAAIRLAQRAKELSTPLSICVLEKGSQIGSHILSGAVFEPRALNTLIPDWQSDPSCPVKTAVTQDAFYYLTSTSRYQLPTLPQMHNKGNYIISLGQLCKWLGGIAEGLGVEIYTGFAASQLIIEDNKVLGITTSDIGLDKEGQPKASFQAGIALMAKQTLLAEGCRGHLSEEVMKRFELRADVQPQTYAIGIKEIWEVDSKHYEKGSVMHTIGWPLNHQTYGGSFVYHLEDNKVAIGLVIGLDYENPYLSPYDEFNRFKHHPSIAALLENGRCIRYGARALNEGGYQSIPKLSFPGGLLIGCGAGFMNVPKIKGSHTAMYSGILAADTLIEAFKQPTQTQTQPQTQSIQAPLHQYDTHIKQSWIMQELYQVRNIRPSFKWGLGFGLLYSALDTYLFRGKTPWTFKHHEDNLQLKSKESFIPIEYAKPDGKLSFDKMTSVSRSNTYHEENQPCHLRLKDAQIPITLNLKRFDMPETRYCPAGVYELVQKDNAPALQINAQNCIHCKTCDIKDYAQNIYWVPPEGGGGPNYGDM